MDQAEMARRVYAVRDSFRDILVNTCGTRNETSSSADSAPPFPRLTALCSTVVGENMECEGESDESDGEEEIVTLLDSIYETIPLEHRRLTVLSHGLSLILNSTVHHPTLLIILLDLTLEHRLQHESFVLLHSLLSFTLGGTSIASHEVPPICHPSHANFLLELRERWVVGGFPESKFFGAFVDVMEVTHRYEIWVCKAVHNLAQLISTRDLVRHIWMIRAFSHFTNNSPTLERAKSTPSNDDRREATDSRFCAWLKISLERYLPHVVSDEVAVPEELTHALGEMLTVALTSNRGTTAEARGLLLCLATCWLSCPSQSLKERVLDCLRGVPFETSTFTPLIASVFTSSDGCLDIFHQTTQSLAHSLHSCGLSQLESSLWGSALAHIEYPPRERQLSHRHGVEKVQSHRHKLIELVDEADKRCLAPPDTPTVALRRPNPGLLRSHEGHLNGTLEWEPSVCFTITPRYEVKGSYDGTFDEPVEIAYISLGRYEEIAEPRRGKTQVAQSSPNDQLLFAPLRCLFNKIHIALNPHNTH
ncbi:hypothetical protein H0H81_003106 [Sphagnurus paluster]|uniref:Uncharacterized protein n=1 Tax=Sphagnurus paluster TaxID=117069 RepID=A0A9P7GLM7_9AGAR|nr:hypothetical protein H0H81_003106 [Sphagnurus paluster]